MPRSDAAANRTALLDAAARVLASAGPRASLDAIAREAGVGIATLYRNFTDRDELVAALMHRAFTLVAQFAAEAEHGGAEPVQALHTFLVRLLDHRADLTLMLGGPGRRAGVPAPLIAPITADLDAVISRGVREGTIRPGVSAVDILVAGAMLANAQLPEPAWEQVARRHASLIVDGLRARTDSSALTAPLSPDELDRAFSREP